MRKLFTYFAAAGMAALLAAPAATAAPGDFLLGSLTLRLAGLPPITLPANPGAAVSGGPSGTPVMEIASAFGPGGVDIPDSLFTGVPQIVDLRITGLLKPTAPATFTGSFASVATPLGVGGVGFGGLAALSGVTTICVFSCAFIQVAIPLTIVGVGGVFTGTALGQPLTVTAAPGWVTGLAGMTGINSELLTLAGGATCVPVTCPISVLAFGTGNGVYVSTVTATGVDARTASGGGIVTLVTPVRTTSLAGVLPLFVFQTLTFEGVPEPGTLLLLGAGVAGLLAVGRRKRK